MNGLTQDLRYAVRQLRKNPVFTVVAVGTLALAIGANTAIFSLVHTVLLTRLPYPQVDRLMMIWGRNQSRGDNQFPITGGEFTEWKQKTDVFEDIAASYDDEATLTGAGEPRLVLGYAFTPNYFHILGVAPEMGRTFTEEEARSGTDVVVLSDQIWRTTFHGDPEILGKPITLDAKAYTVVGVMPPDFGYPPRTELWKPMELTATASVDFAIEHRFIRAIGRLKPGVSMEEAQVRMNALERQVAAQHPETDAGNETWVEPVLHQLSGDIRAPLLALLGAVGFVLIIACVNILSLLLARAANRRAEISLRVAIGASRLRLLQQFLIESLLLSSLGGGLGVMLALWCTRFLVTIFPNGVANVSIPRVESIPIDGPVLWFALGVMVLTALLFGLAPALQSSGTGGREALRESTRGSTSTLRSAQVRRILVSTEVGLSLVLMAAAGLMLESFRHVYQEDLGFHPDNVLALEVFLPGNRYPADQPRKQRSFIENALNRMTKLPGVRSAAATNYLPLTGFWGTAAFSIAGQSMGSVKPQADNRLVTPGYFSTMGISLLRGRDFAELDRVGSEQVAVVNSTFARRYFGDQDPLGKILDLGDPAHPQRWRVVGVVSDVKAFGPEQIAHADLYRSLGQASFPLLAFVLRTEGNPTFSLKPAEHAIWDGDKDLPVFDAMPMDTLASQSVTLRRTSTILVASFATLALILAAVGLYGMMAYTVVQRTREMGIRRALGAKPGDVQRLVVQNGMKLVLIGEVVGLAATLALMRLASGLLYGTSPSEPRTLAAAIGLLSLVAFVAAYIPATRAAKMDPMQALRYE
jgi:predicted permease